MGEILFPALFPFVSGLGKNKDKRYWERCWGLSFFLLYFEKDRKSTCAVFRMVMKIKMTETVLFFQIVYLLTSTHQALKCLKNKFSM